MAAARATSPDLSTLPIELGLLSTSILLGEHDKVCSTASRINALIGPSEGSGIAILITHIQANLKDITSVKDLSNQRNVNIVTTTFRSLNRNIDTLISVRAAESRIIYGHPQLAATGKNESQLSQDSSREGKARERSESERGASPLGDQDAVKHPLAGPGSMGAGAGAANAPASKAEVSPQTPTEISFMVNDNRPGRSGGHSEIISEARWVIPEYTTVRKLRCEIARNYGVDPSQVTLIRKDNNLPIADEVNGRKTAFVRKSHEANDGGTWLKSPYTIDSLVPDFF